MQHEESFTSSSGTKHLETDSKSVQWHIPSKYSKEMSMKSKVVSGVLHVTIDNFMILLKQVPLGVLFHNENKTDEMCIIMKHLHKYVPSKPHKITYHLPEEDFVCEDSFCHRILFGGDQLTVCRCRGAQLVRRHDDAAEERYAGLVPVIEDWHARLTLMRVIYCVTVWLIILIFLLLIISIFLITYR